MTVTDAACPQRTLALARAAGEAVRGLNHAGIDAGGLDWPADAYDLLGELALLAAGLPRLLGQAGRWLRLALDARALGCDDGTDPAAAVAGTVLLLDAARGSAAALAGDLAGAQSRLSAVHGTGPEPGTEGKEDPGREGARS
jgi:hypothetical protein